MADLGSKAQQGLLTKRTGLYLDFSSDQNGAQQGLLTKRTGLYLDLAWDNNGTAQGLLTKRSFFAHIIGPHLPVPAADQAATGPKAFDCPEAIKDCPCNDEPIANFSAEAPDQQLFCQTVTVTEEPGLGQCGQQISDTEICCSPISRGDAYLCALQAAQETVWETWKDQTCPVTDPPLNCPPECDPFCPPVCPPTTPANPPPAPRPVAIFLNEPQSCTVPCPDGGSFVYTVAAGVISSLNSQARANSLAHALACRIGQQTKLCLRIVGATTDCKNDFMSFKIQVTGPLTQWPLRSSWTIEGPAIDPNILTYNTSQAAVSGTAEIEIFGTPTVAIDTYIIATIHDFNRGISVSRTIPISIVDCTIDWTNITPDIRSSDVTYWNNGFDIPEGTYRIAYVNGAWISPGPIYLVGDGVLAAGKGRGYYIVYNNGGTEVAFPPSGLYASQALCEAANAGAAIVINHIGGKIGMYLHDSPYADNSDGSPNPAFKLETV